MSLIFATQLAAIATAVLAVFAIITAAFAYLTYRKQSQETGILIAENQQQALERRRDQASRIFIWAEAQPGQEPASQTVPGIIAHIKNTSQQPVYDGFTGHCEGSQWIDCKERKPDLPTFPVLMPGEQLEVIIGFENPVPAAEFWQGNSGLLTSVRFRDAGGLNWQRHSDGRLEEGPAAGEAAPQSSGHL
jgi:hypothetical protein